MKTNDVMKSRDRKMVKHILDCCGDEIENLEHDVGSAMIDLKCMRKSAHPFAAGEYLVMSGCFLCYYSDVDDFLENEMGYVVSDDEEKNWNVYKKAVANIVERIYIKERKIMDIIEEELEERRTV